MSSWEEWEELNRFQRVLRMKKCVVIDASVILASGVPTFKESIPCQRYLKKINKQYRAFITKPIMGELLNELCEINDTNLSNDAYNFTKELLKEFIFIPHMHLNDNDLNLLNNYFSVIPKDDRLHIAHVCEANRDWVPKQKDTNKLSFATIDRKIVDETTIRLIQGRLGLEIINPLSVSL